MTLNEWATAHNVFIQCIGNEGALQVFSTDPELWHLSDYLVSSVVSGPSVVLVRRLTT